MKRISLTRGKYAMVDDEDFARLSAMKWRVMVSANGHWYAVRGNRYKKLLMHRVILGAGKGQIVDHVNNDGLDNRRENLRLCTVAQNQQNKFVVRSTAGFKGVSFVGKNFARPYKSVIQVNGKQIGLGTFATAIEAAMAYDAAARFYFREFARPNFQIAS